jgi:hypothetical protein
VLDKESVNDVEGERRGERETNMSWSAKTGESIDVSANVVGDDVVHVAILDAASHVDMDLDVLSTRRKRQNGGGRREQSKVDERRPNPALRGRVGGCGTIRRTRLQNLRVSRDGGRG